MKPPYKAEVCLPGNFWLGLPEHLGNALSKALGFSRVFVMVKYDYSCPEPFTDIGCLVGLQWIEKEFPMLHREILVSIAEQTLNGL